MTSHLGGGLRPSPARAHGLKQGARAPSPASAGEGQTREARAGGREPHSAAGEAGRFTMRGGEAAAGGQLPRPAPLLLPAPVFEAGDESDQDEIDRAEQSFAGAAMRLAGGVLLCFGGVALIGYALTLASEALALAGIGFLLSLVALGLSAWLTLERAAQPPPASRRRPY